MKPQRCMSGSKKRRVGAMSASPGPADLTTIAVVAAYLGQDPAQDAEPAANSGERDLRLHPELDRVRFRIGMRNIPIRAAATATRCLVFRERPRQQRSPRSLIDGRAVASSARLAASRLQFRCLDPLSVRQLLCTRGHRNVEIVPTPPAIHHYPARRGAGLYRASGDVHYKLRDKSGLVSEAAMQQTTSYLANRHAGLGARDC